MRPAPALCVLCFLLVWVIAACGGAGGGQAPSAVDDGTQIPTATAESAQTGRPVVRSSLQSACHLTPTGADIRVEYSVVTGGSTMLTRVKLLEDGREVEDSGVLEQRTFRRVSVFHVEAGAQRTYRIAAEARGASVANVQTTVRCGSVATPTPGPRA